MLILVHHALTPALASKTSYKAYLRQKAVSTQHPRTPYHCSDNTTTLTPAAYSSAESSETKPNVCDRLLCEKNGFRYFRTGDLGRMEDETYLRITGRIKEQYKLENGKYVVPGPIEAAMTSSTYITQVRGRRSLRRLCVSFRSVDCAFLFVS